MGIETYEGKRHQQLALLSKQLSLNHFGITGKHKIKVFTFEANMGKTETLIETLKSMSDSDSFTSSLIICKFKSEVTRIANRIPNAIAIHSDNKKYKDEELKNYNVVVTTQAQYLILCRNRKKRELFFEGRSNLIFDEELSILQMDIFNSNNITRMETILKEIFVTEKLGDELIQIDLASMYKHIIKDIEAAKNENYDKKMKFFHFVDRGAEQAIDLLISFVEKSKFTKNYLTHLRIKYNIKTKKQDVINKLEMLKRYFNNPKVIVSDKTLYTYNDKMMFHLLPNNIMLDASAKFHYIYQICDLFEIEDSERIFEHDNWKIHFIDKNSTSASKHKNDAYYPNVVDLILSNIIKEDKVLLLGSEEDLINLRDDYSERLVDYSISQSNFQAMRGKNDWEDHNKCFVIHNPSISFAYYAFMYMLYTGNELTDDDLMVNKTGWNMGFVNNPELEKIRRMDIFRNIYQGIKRIARGKYQNKEATVWIINSDKGFSSMLKEQLYKATVTEVYTKKNYDNTNRESKATINSLINKVSELSSGEYELSSLLSEIGYKAKNFYRIRERFLSNELMRSRNVEIKKINKSNFLLIS